MTDPAGRLKPKGPQHACQVPHQTTCGAIVSEDLGYIRLYRADRVYRAYRVYTPRPFHVVDPPPTPPLVSPPAWYLPKPFPLTPGTPRTTGGEGETLNLNSKP